MVGTNGTRLSGYESVLGANGNGYRPSERYVAGDGWDTVGTVSFASPPLLGQARISEPYREVVYYRAAVKALAEPFSQLPLRLWDGDPKGKNAREITDHPLARLWRQPNAYLTGPDLWKLHMIGYRRGGATYLFLGDREGQPIGPGQVPAQALPVFRWALEPKGDDGYGQPAAYRYAGQPTKLRDYPRHAVLAILDHDPRNWTQGWGDGDALESTIDMAHQARRYLASLTRSGGDPGAWLVHPSRPGEAEQKRLQNETDDEFSQSRVSRYRHLFGKIEVVPNPIRPRDMEYEKLLKWTRGEELAALGVPPPLVGDLERATYENIRTAELLMWRGPNGILATAARTENALNLDFLPRMRAPSTWQYRFDTSDVEVLQKDGREELQLAAEVSSKGVGVSVTDALAGLGAEIPLPAGVGTERFLGVGLRPSENLAGEIVATVLANLSAQVASGAIPPESARRIAIVTMPGTVTEADAAAIFPEPPEPEDSETDDSEEGDSGDEGGTEDDEGQNAAGPNAQLREGAMDTTGRPATAASHRLAFKVGAPIEPDKRLARLIESWLADYEDATRELWSKAKADDAQSHVPAETYVPDERGLDAFLLPIDEWADALRDATGSRLEQLFLEALLAAQGEWGGSFVSVTDPAIVRFLEAQKVDLVRVVETVNEQVRDLLLAQFAGESGPVEPLIAKALPELDPGLARIFGSKDARASAIARTETGRAQNGAQYLQMRTAGVTRIEWVHGGNPNPRPQHLAMNGEQVGLGELFSNGLRYPHDPTAPAEQVINCSCSVAAVAFEGDL